MGADAHPQTPLRFLPPFLLFFSSLLPYVFAVHDTEKIDKAGVNIITTTYQLPRCEGKLIVTAEANARRVGLGRSSPCDRQRATSIQVSPRGRRHYAAYHTQVTSRHGRGQGGDVASVWSGRAEGGRAYVCNLAQRSWCQC